MSRTDRSAPIAGAPFERSDRVTYTLQNRWRIEKGKLYYYGMRKAQFLLKNSYRISKKERALISALPKALDQDELDSLRRLIEEGIVVRLEARRRTPRTLDEATFCRTCAANDFTIPGLELDDEGVCPMCASKDRVQGFRSVLPVMNDFPRSRRSRFDVALFYTGGKDSSFLLHYLANVCDLNVLALTWEIPYMSESAKKSIERAKQKCPNVEFINRKMPDRTLARVYHRLYELEGNTCACPSLAYILFYPELVDLRVPYFVLGNEPVQMLNLYYNRLAPSIAYQKKAHRLMGVAYNALRLLTLRKPFKKGQLQAHLTMRQLAYGDPFIKRISGYQNDLVKHVTEAIREVPEMLLPLKRALRRSHTPAFVHVDFNDISGGKYDWRSAKDLIREKIGWVEPKEASKGLHTSCTIERCKEYSQFKNFYEMRSRMIPFSAIEIALSVSMGHASRDEAINEIRDMGFSLTEIPECRIMKDYLNRVNG